MLHARQGRQALLQDFVGTVFTALLDVGDKADTTGIAFLDQGCWSVKHVGRLRRIKGHAERRHRRRGHYRGGLPTRLVVTILGSWCKRTSSGTGRNQRSRLEGRDGPHEEDAYRRSEGHLLNVVCRQQSATGVWKAQRILFGRDRQVFSTRQGD